MPSIDNDVTRMAFNNWDEVKEIIKQERDDKPIPDELRERVRLTDEEMQPCFQNKISVKGGGFWIPEKVADAQIDKAYPIILKEVGKWLESHSHEKSDYGDSWIYFNIKDKDIAALKRGRLPDA